MYIFSLDKEDLCSIGHTWASVCYKTTQHKPEICNVGAELEHLIPLWRYISALHVKRNVNWMTPDLLPPFVTSSLQCPHSLSFLGYPVRNSAGRSRAWWVRVVRCQHCLSVLWFPVTASSLITFMVDSSKLNQVSQLFEMLFLHHHNTGIFLAMNGLRELLQT